uniref:Inositol-1-monophosphatase n=1 Tax=Mesocestoides corti TaxID=53468 RepID=A0A5K3EXE8_MESCO
MLDIVKAIAREAGSVILSALHQPTLVHEKISYADLVTDTDKQVEDLIKSRILAKFPNHKIIAEESAENRSILTSEPTWIIDPIDGTSNFVSKFPFCAVCIGYYSEKQALCSVVYNPIHNQMFCAERDKGAFLNDQRIRVSGCTQLHNALILTDWGGDRNASNLDTKAANMRCLIAEARGVRTMGSAALHMCQVAAGQGDAFFEFGIHCWDYAASSLIVTEAGGYCCNIDGGPIDLMARHCVAASSKELAEAVCQRITPISYPRD